MCKEQGGSGALLFNNMTGHPKREKSMKTMKLMATTCLTLAAGSAVADGHMADEMTIVSWGGAYSASQQNAYHDPYVEKTGVTIINDESSAEAVAKLRAMNEAGNVTWDVVDVVASDAIRLCDEGLALEIDADEQLAPGDDGSSASDDFGDLLVSDCFIPQIVYSTTVGYRTDLVGDTPPTEICAIFDTEAYPGKRSLEKRPIGNLEWALLCDGVAKEDIYDVLETDEGQAQAFAKLDTVKDDVIWWTAGADTPQLLADGEVVMGSTYNGRLFSLIEEQGQPVGMLWDAQVFDLDGWIIPTGLSPERQARALDYHHPIRGTSCQKAISSGTSPCVTPKPTRSMSRAIRPFWPNLAAVPWCVVATAKPPKGRTTRAMLFLNIRTMRRRRPRIIPPNIKRL